VNVVDYQYLESMQRRSKGASDLLPLSGFICRYQLKKDSSNNSIISTSLHGLLHRGLDLSEYTFAYNRNELLSWIKRSGTEEETNILLDPYAMAIAQLHISIVPENLPCRSKEKATIVDFIRSSILALGSQKPLYISGMPGTGEHIFPGHCIRV
jgi:hypothetical protein